MMSNCCCVLPHPALRIDVLEKCLLLYLADAAMVMKNLKCYRIAPIFLF